MRTYLRDQEILVPAARMQVLRLCWGVVVVGALVGAEVLVSSSVGSPTAAAVVLRSTVSFTGLALLGSAAFGRGLSWLLPAGVALVTYVLGKTTDDQIRPWAWILHPGGDVTWWTSGSLLVAGLGAFVLLDCRITTGDDAT